MKAFIRLLTIVFSGIVLTALTPAHALSSFGRTTVGATPSGGLRADFKRGSKFTLAEKGTLRQICAYLDTQGGGTFAQEVRYALYRDRNGAPAEQVAETPSRFSLSAGTAPTMWYCLETAAVPIEPGAYWVMIHTGNNTGIVRYYYDGAPNWFGNTDTFSDGASDTFGVGGTGEGTMSIRVDYSPLSEARLAGRTTVGTRVSSAMSAQYKRGSSFVLTENAEVISLNAYIDGLGGTPDSQLLWMSLYEDVNGEPKTLVMEAPNYGGWQGRSGRWVSTLPPYPSPQYLKPGKYWIMLSRGPSTGMSHYYYDGTGNWRGSPSPDERAPPFFGASSSGDGTISATILYKPTNVVSHTFGRTTPGNVASGGLRADFIRGSRFDSTASPVVGNSLQALWAYMDGNGGTSGSQKVRLALYQASGSSSIMYKVVVSDEVTIPAGTPARWVRFAVPRTQVTDGTHHIFVWTGGTDGVARYFASTDSNNWNGAALGFSSPAPENMYLGFAPPFSGPALQPGNTTLSVYAEFLRGN